MGENYRTKDRIIFGDEILLTSKSWHPITHEKSEVGLFICDTLGETRQCCVIRTTPDGMLENGQLDHDGSFVFVKISETSSSVPTLENLHFGEPFLLKHVSSGRFLCASNSTAHAVSVSSAEIRVDHQCLSLLSPNLTRSNNDSPIEHLVPNCTFRFVAVSNYGRDEVMTGDNLWLTTDSGRLVRAGIGSINNGEPEVYESEPQVDHTGMVGDTETADIDPLDPVPFDICSPLLKYEVDICDFGIGANLDILATEQGCFVWSIKQRMKLEEMINVKDGDSLEGNSYLRTGTSLRLRCLERDALLWADHASCGYVTDAGKSGTAQRCFYAVLNVLQEAGFMKFGGSHDINSVASTVPLGSNQQAEAFGLLKPEASFKGMFTIDPVDAPGSLNVQHKTLRWGMPFRLRHNISESFLAICERPETIPKETETNTADYFACFISLPASKKDYTLEECQHIDSISDFSLPTEMTRMDHFLDATTFVMVPAQPLPPGTDDRIHVSKAVGWLQTFNPPIGSSSCLRLSSSGSVVRTSDGRVSLESMIPVKVKDELSRDLDENEEAPENDSLFYHPFLDAETRAKLCLSFQESDRDLDLVQMEVVPCALVSLCRMTRSGMVRVRAFENYMRSFKDKHSLETVTPLSDGSLPPDFVKPAPSMQLMSVMDPTATDMMKVMQPLLEVMERGVAFLRGEFWPDEGRVELGATAHFDGTRGVTGNVYKPPTKADIALKSVFDEAADWTAVDSLVARKRRQCLFRCARYIDLIMIPLRAVRLAGISMHKIPQYKGLLHLVALSEECLKLASINNQRSQIYIASRKFTGRRMIAGYENGWIAEVMAMSQEWGQNPFSVSQRPGRVNMLINTLVLENKHLTAALLNDETAEYLCRCTLEQGIRNSHSLTLVTQMCETGSGDQNRLAQARLFKAYVKIFASGENMPFAPHLGLFFLRRPSQNQCDDNGVSPSAKALKSATKVASLLGENENLSTRIEALKQKEDAMKQTGRAEINWNSNKIDWTSGVNCSIDEEVCTSLDSFTRQSLLLSGTDRIFRISVAFDPVKNFAFHHGENHWCLGCHLSKTRHHHCPFIGGCPSEGSRLSPETERGNLAQFITQGEEPIGSGTEENGRKIVDVMQWCHGTTPGLGEDNNWVDLALVVRLARSSQEHTYLVRYVASFVRFIVSIRSQLNTIQARFPYESLLLAMNFFALGFNLRTAFAALLSAVYIDAYPHMPKPLLRKLHLLNPIGYSSDSEATAGKKVDELLQRFRFSGYRHVIHSASKLNLSECGLRLIVGSPEEREKPADGFLHNTSSSKFMLLIKSLFDSLEDERLITLVSSVDSQDWSKDHMSAFEFVDKLVEMVQLLTSTCFIHKQGDIITSIQRIFTILRSMQRDALSLATGAELNRVFYAADSLAEAFDMDVDKPPPLDEKKAAYASKTSSSVSFSPSLSEVPQPDLPNEMIINTKNPMMSNKSIDLVEENQIDEEDRSIEMTTRKKLKPSKSIKEQADACDDEELLDEAFGIAQRKGLSLKRLSLMLGEANAVALLIHDEGRQDRATDICVEHEIWTMGQQWHHSQKVTPFICASNQRMANKFCEDAASRKALGASRSQLSSSVERLSFGPVANIDNPEGLPIPDNMDGVSEAAMPSSWQWINSWCLDGKGPLETEFDAAGGGGGWEYGHNISQTDAWLDHPRPFYRVRRRFWTRRRERKSALILIVEAIKHGYCTISAARSAIQSARRTSVDGSRKGRTLDLDYLLMHMHPIHAIGNLVTDKYLQDEEDELKLVENEALDLDVFSVLLDDDLPEDDDEPASPVLGPSHFPADRLSGEFADKEVNLNSKLEEEFKPQPARINILETKLDEEDFELTVRLRERCVSRSLQVLSSFQTISADFRVATLLDKLVQFQHGVGNPTTQSHGLGLSSLGSRKTGVEVEFDPRRAYLDEAPWMSRSGKVNDFDVRSAVVGVNSQDEAAASLTAQLMRKLKYNGKTPTTATELSELRKVVRCVHRLQQAFATAGVHPRNLLDRFVPKTFQDKADNIKDSQSVGSHQGDFLDMVGFQWLLAGIGCHLLSDDIYIIKAVFCEDGSELINSNSDGGPNVAGRTRMLPRKEHPHENLAPKQTQYKSVMNLHRGQRLLQEKSMIVDVPHLLLCLDNIPPIRPPRLNSTGTKLLISLFESTTNLDVVSLSVTAPKATKSVSEKDDPNPGSCPITGTRFQKHNRTCETHTCPNRNASLLALVTTFIEGQTGSARDPMSHSRTASEALALLIRSFRTTAEMISGMSAAVSGRPNHGSPDRASFENGGDTQRALTALANIAKKLSSNKSFESELSSEETLHHDLKNASALLKHLSALVLVRRENEGCDSKGNFLYLLAHSGAIESAMTIMMMKRIDEIKLEVNQGEAFDDVVCARHAASGFVLSMLSSGTPKQVVDLVSPYLGELVQADFDLLSGVPGIHQHSGLVYVVAALVRQSPDIAFSVPQSVLNKWAHMVKSVKFEDDIQLHTDSLAYRNLFEHLLLSSPVPFPHLQSEVFKVVIRSGIFHISDHGYKGALSDHPSIKKHQRMFANCLSLAFAPKLEHVVIDEQYQRNSNMDNLMRTYSPTTFHYFVAGFVQGIRIAAYAARGSDVGANDISSKCAEMFPLDMLVHGLKDMTTMGLTHKVVGHDARLHLNLRSKISRNEDGGCKIGQEFSLYRGYGLTILPWGYTRGLRAFSLFLQHVFLSKAAPFGSAADTPTKWMGAERLSSSNGTSATAWSSPMLRPRQVHDMLVWAAECGTVIRKFTIFLKQHAKFIATPSGRAVFTADKAACKRRQHHVMLEDLTDPSGPTRDTFILIFEALLPCLAALHVYSRPDHTAVVSTNNRASALVGGVERASNDSYRSSASGARGAALMAGSQIGPLMAAAHTKAWSAIGGALFDLLDTPSLVKHMECVCGAICPDFKHVFDRYLLPQSRKFLERLSMDSLVDFDLVTMSPGFCDSAEGIEEEEEGDEDVGSDTENVGSEEGNGIDGEECHNAYCNENLCFNFIDERQLLESQDLYELNADPKYHHTLSGRSILFGSTVSSLHSGGLVISQIPYPLCSSAKLSAILRRFGKIKGVLIRSMASKAKSSAESSPAGGLEHVARSGIASVYFEIPNEKKYFGGSGFAVPTLSGNDDEDDDLEVDDASGGDLSVRLICLPTGSIAENFSVSPDERIISVLGRISSEIIRAVHVLDMRVSVNGQEIRRNFKMSSIFKYAVDLEIDSSSSSSSTSTSKLADRKQQRVVGFGSNDEKTSLEHNQRIIQISVTWNSVLAAARCLDGAEPSFLIDSMKPLNDSSKGSRTKTNLPPLFASPTEDLQTSRSISRLKSSSSYSSLSSDASVGAHVTFLEVPRRKVGGVSFLVEDSGLDSFWRRFAAAAQNCEGIAAHISKEFDGLVDFILNIDKISDFEVPSVVDKLVEYLAETYKTNPKKTTSAPKNKLKNFWDHSHRRDNEDADEENGTELYGEYGGYSKEELCYFVMLLLSRFSERADINKPFPMGVKWDQVLPPNVKQSLAQDSKPKPSGGHDNDDFARSVIPEKELLDMPRSEVIRKQIQALLVACGAGSAMVRVIAASEPHSQTLKQALVLSIQLLDGGNHKGQVNLHKMISVMKKSAFVDKLCHVCNLSKEFHDHKAKAQSLLGISHSNNNAGKLAKTSTLYSEMIHDEGLIPVSIVLDSTVFTASQTSDLVSVDRNSIRCQSNELPVVHVLRLAQLMCEGHFKGMQDILREGSGGALDSSLASRLRTTTSSSFTTSWMLGLTSSHRSTFLSSAISLLDSLIGSPSQTRLLYGTADDFVVINQCLRFVTEMCQGPNLENQHAAVVCCEGALISSINKIFIFAVASHQLASYASFIRLISAIIQSCFEAMLSLTEGRPCTLQDPTMLKIYNQFSAEALMIRLDIIGFLVSYLDKVRRKNKVGVISKAKAVFGIDRYRQFTSIDTGSVKTPTGPSYFRYVDQVYEVQQVHKLPPKEEMEPTWMHDYSEKKHEHVGMYSGCTAYNLACTLHALELSTGGKKFNLQLNNQKAMFGNASTHTSIPTYDNINDQNDNGLISDDEIESDETDTANADALGIDDTGNDHTDNEQLESERLVQVQESVLNQDKNGGELEEIEQIAKYFRVLWFPVGNGWQVRSRRDMFGDMSLSIEVNFSEFGLVRVFFPKPAICNFLSDEQKDRMHELLDYTVDDAQILREYFKQSLRLTDELHSKRAIAGDSTFGKLRFANNELLESLPWCLAMVINFIIIISVRRNASNETHFEPASFQTVVHVLGFVLLFSNIVVVLGQLSLQGPIIWSSHLRYIQLEKQKEEKHGGVRLSVLRRLLFSALSFPVACVVTVTVGARLIALTNVDENSLALYQMLRFVALILVLPFIRAFYQIFLQRPFILRSIPRAYVMCYEICTLDGLNSKLIFTAINIVALTRNPLFYCLQLLSILQFSETLRKVVKAVVGPITQLSMTCFFGLLVIYIFMIIAFWAFPEDLNDHAGYYPDDCSADDSCMDDGDDTLSSATMCNSMINCFALFLVNGLTTGGGIGEFISQELGNAPPISSQRTMFRYLFDLSFFVVVTIGLLNLIFGIIIDTFSSIREKAAEEAQIRENKCTICGVTRQEFERSEAGGWKRHYKYEHNLWAYYFFMIHLYTKEPTEYTGLEDYVFKCVQQRSLSWLPRGKALALSEGNFTISEPAATPSETV